MPDSKGVGWRKKIQGRPKELKFGGDETATPEDSTDRRRHHGWRKTLHGSRPGTPVSGTPTTPVPDDAEDAHSERSEVSPPRRSSRPRLARYTSLFNFKDSSKRLEFAEPWSEDAPLPFPYIDPLNALQSVRSHMITSSSKPIPLEHNSGLFRIFEDYRKVREEKEYLETLLQDTFQGWKQAEDQWSDSERRFEAEIRRLDLLIARGTSGMTGLIQARQGSVVDRRRRHRKTISTDRLPPMYDSISQAQLEEDIKVRSRQVLLHRPASPSGKMTALSKQFIGKSVDLPIGNPPDENRKITLSRKVQSELNLASLGRIESTQSTDSVNSSFSGSTGDPLPDEVIVATPTLMESAVECDAFVALRELGTLVARRRGLSVDSFIQGLMMLLANESEVEVHTRTPQEQEPELSSSTHDLGRARKPYIGKTLTPRRTLRRFQSQPQLSSDQKRRRHFSFEPGDDYLQALEEELQTYEGKQQNSDSTDSDMPSSERFRDTMLPSHLGGSTPSSQTLIADSQKPSKIPSPVQTMGRLRRENSASSLQSVIARPSSDRRDSRSSVLTAFRENSSGSLRSLSKSRTSSVHNLWAANSSLPSKDQSDSPRVRNSIMALAAAKNASKTPICRGGSPASSITRPSTIGSSSRATRPAGPPRVENETSQDHM